MSPDQLVARMTELAQFEREATDRRSGSVPREEAAAAPPRPATPASLADLAGGTPRRALSIKSDQGA